MDVSLNSEQRHALEEAKAGKNLFISGGAGTGKSVVLQEIARQATALHQNVLLCAPTAAAAQLIGGVTLHRALRFKEGPLLTQKGLKTMIHTDRRLAAADVIIVDEISMCRADLFDSLFASMRKIVAKRQRPMQLIVVGDFFQLPPVTQTTNNEKSILEAAYGQNFGRGYAFQSRFWEEAEFRSIMLHETVRATDAEFVANLNLAREGDPKALRYFTGKSCKMRFEDGINIVGLKADADRLNMEGLLKLGQTPTVFRTELAGDATNADVAHVPLELPLSPGARVFCKINDYQDGLYNGLQGTVKFCTEDVIVVQFDGRRGTTYVEKHTFKVNDFALDENGNIEITERGQYSQFPLDLAYAVTMHRSQGATFDAVNLEPYAWDYGQLYVALSRVRDIASLHIAPYLDGRYLQADPLVKKFYTRLDNGQSAPQKLQTAGKDGKTVIARVPEHLKNSINEAAAAWKELGPDERYKQQVLLVPDDLRAEICELIRQRNQRVG